MNVILFNLLIAALVIGALMLLNWYVERRRRKAVDEELRERVTKVPARAEAHHPGIARALRAATRGRQRTSLGGGHSRPVRHEFWPEPEHYQKRANDPTYNPFAENPLFVTSPLNNGPSWVEKAWTGQGGESGGGGASASWDEPCRASPADDMPPSYDSGSSSCDPSPSYGSD